MGDGATCKGYAHAQFGSLQQVRGIGKRHDTILMLDVLSDEMALAKVQLRLFDNIMVDYLNLMKVQGRWTVVAKHFWRKGPAA